MKKIIVLLVTTVLALKAGEFISFENQRSIRAKADYAAKNFLKGVMVWQIAFDKDGALISSIDNSRSKGNELVVYLPNYIFNSKSGSFTFDKLDSLLKKKIGISTIVYGFAQPHSDGKASFDNPKLDLGEGVDSDGNIKKLIALKKDHPDIKLFLSFGGWGYRHEFYKAARNGNLKRLAFNSVALLPDQFDGIDIDWEFQTKQERTTFGKNISQFATYVNQAIEKRNKKTYFSIALLPNHQFNKNFSSLKELSQKVDWINLMAYNYEVPDWSEITGHNAPLYSPNLPSKRIWKKSYPKFESVDTSVKTFLSAGVNPQKLVLGVPFYGRAFKEVKAGKKEDGLYQTHGGAAKKDAIVSYARLVGKIPLDESENGSSNFTYFWDDVSKVPYAYSKAE